jgi:hypothetical protein
MAVFGIDTRIVLKHHAQKQTLSIGKQRYKKIIAEISSPNGKENDNILLVEQKFQKLSMEGEIILAKRNGPVYAFFPPDLCYTPWKNPTKM